MSAHCPDGLSVLSVVASVVASGSSVSSVTGGSGVSSPAAVVVGSGDVVDDSGGSKVRPFNSSHRLHVYRKELSLKMKVKSTYLGTLFQHNITVCT